MLTQGLYEVLESSTTQVSVKLSDASHPIFQAHFPNKPILPGFVHLEIISDVFHLEVTSVKKAKYQALVLPSQILQYIKNDNKIKILCEEKSVASFVL